MREDLDLGSRRWTQGSSMTASVLESLYKSFGWTLINSEYIHLSSFFLTRTPGYLRAVRHTSSTDFRAVYATHGTGVPDGTEIGVICDSVCNDANAGIMCVML